MALSQQAFTADGVETEYAVNFPYLSRNHVHAYVNNLPDGVTTNWISDTVIEVFKDGNPVLADAEVLIYRRTSPEAPLVDFQPGTVTEADLDLANTQSLYLAQEANDFADRAVAFSGLGVYTEALQIQTEIQADRDYVDAKAAEAAQSAQDAADEVINAQTEVSNAQAQANAAAASASTAATHESNAAASAAAAAAAADSVIWNDVVFLNSGDSPFNIVDGDAGRLFAVDASGGPVTINLPSIATLSLSGPWSVGVKKTDNSANAVSVVRNGTDTIEGSVSKTHGQQNTGAVYIPDTDPTPDQWSTFSVGDTPDGSITAQKLGTQAVETAKIKDDNVTLGKMEHGTQGQVLVYAGAGGDPTRLDPGTAGHVLTSQGAGANLAWAAPKAYEEWTRLASQAFGTGNLVDRTGLPAGITALRIFVKDASFSSQSDNLLLRVGPVGGIVTTGYVNSINGSTKTDGFHIYNAFSSGKNMSGFIELELADAATNFWMLRSTIMEDGGGDMFSVTGYISLAGALERFRFTSDNPGSRNFDNGIFYTHYRK